MGSDPSYSIQPSYLWTSRHLYTEMSCAFGGHDTLLPRALPFPAEGFPSGMLFVVNSGFHRNERLLKSIKFWLHWTTDPYVICFFSLQPDFSNHNISNCVLHGLVVSLQNLFSRRTFYLPILKAFSPYSWVLYSDTTNVRWDLVTPSSKFRRARCPEFVSFLHYPFGPHFCQGPKAQGKIYFRTSHPSESFGNRQRMPRETALGALGLTARQRQGWSTVGYTHMPMTQDEGLFGPVFIYLFLS